MQQNNFLNNAFLHHLSIQCADPKSLSSFYSETLGMKSKQIHHKEKIKWLCFGNDRRIIFSPGKKKNLDFAAFSLKDKNSLMNFKNIHYMSIHLVKRPSQYKCSLRKHH